MPDIVGWVAFTAAGTERGFAEGWVDVTELLVVELTSSVNLGILEML